MIFKSSLYFCCVCDPTWDHFQDFLAYEKVEIFGYILQPYILNGQLQMIDSYVQPSLSCLSLDPALTTSFSLCTGLRHLNFYFGKPPFFCCAHSIYTRGYRTKDSWQRIWLQCELHIRPFEISVTAASYLELVSACSLNWQSNNIA